MPFTTEEFFALFAAYNEAVWPANWVLSGLALVAVALAVRGSAAAGRLSSGVLAILWLWMGVIYHIAFFTTINPAAWVFGAAFIAQAVVLLWIGVRKRRLSFRVAPDLSGIIGAALIVYALILYPLVGYVSGHRYPAVPTFGAPCPTTIFTLGALLWVAGRVPWSVAVIPLAWAAVGSFAAIHLTVPQDYGLLFAGVITVMLLGRRTAGRGLNPPTQGVTVHP